MIQWESQPAQRKSIANCLERETLMTSTKTPWWQRGIVYQIYPRSYQDSNGDGIGDLPGITRRLDYLQWLGIDAIWISPMYPSPMADFGYDVSDYVNVHPIFGTLDDLDALVAAAHQRGLRVILDLVPNHTSDRHPWFLESRSSRDNPRRDWYVWRDPAPGGGPPNNWLSRFDGKSAWQWDEPTGQYYLHSFLAEQPDLEWRNPAVRAAMLDVVRFWFDRGIDGFRIDVAYRVMKDPLLRDNPPNPDWQKGQDPFERLLEVYNKNTPDAHQFNRWLRRVSDEYDDRVLIGEMYLSLADLVTHYGQGDEQHLPFNFNLILTPWNAAAVRAVVEEYESLLPEHAWPNWVLGNHDKHRVASRVGPQQARVAMMLLLTLRGTPTVYYGDEIGMQDVPIPADKVQDPWEKFVPGLGLGRDPERTPMQWNAAPNAGFCSPNVEPWLPVAADHDAVNVASQSDTPGSMLDLTHRLIQLRRDLPALSVGSYRSLDAPESVFAYLREAAGQQVLVVLNFTGRETPWPLPAEAGEASLLLSTELDRLEAGNGGQVTLRGNEGLVLQVPG
jgi:alpha-glucosidase